MSQDIEIIPVGGHSDFGRNMTAVRVGREIVIFDMGVKLDPLQDLPEGEGVDTLDVHTLRDLGAIPDDSILSQVDGKVVAIVISHAHADHVAAVEKLAGRYPDAPILGSPYTIRFIEDLCTPRRGRNRGSRDGPASRTDQRLSIPNRLVPMTGKDRVRVGRGSLEVELVHITHSIIGATLPVLHTPKGAVVYALDFKLDDTPVLGAKPDYRRLAQLGREGVHLLITEATNAHKDEKTDSEMIARLRLKDLLFGVDHEKEALFVSTFSSNSARIHSMIEYAEDLDRDILLMGRSMERYQSIAASTGLLNVPDHVRMFPNRESANQALRLVAEDPTKYLVILTGHQGEPGALLTRIANGQTPYKMSKRDDVIFSSNVIPTPTNIEARGDLEKRLKKAGARVFKGAHASGHASGVDHRELLMLLQPEHIVPAHGGFELQQAYSTLAEEEGWKPRRDIHVLANAQRFVLGKGPSGEPRKVDAAVPKPAAKRGAPKKAPGKSHRPAAKAPAKKAAAKPQKPAGRAPRKAPATHRA
ncbi:MAG TPA: RNase J family beta-CASP ribonuclease [Candidatus Thermoplasmatota archaeon]|nr:RNase J family beta-CASP ribonuclease [Candidatus Thermoplasmatota archaeon]